LAKKHNLKEREVISMDFVKDVLPVIAPLLSAGASSSFLTIPDKILTLVARATEPMSAEKREKLDMEAYKELTDIAIEIGSQGGKDVTEALALSNKLAAAYL
jgi:hypothetical protein